MGRKIAAVALVTMLISTPWVRAQNPEPSELAKKARDVFANTCHRCHGKSGTVEGGFSYVLDREQLVARKKIIPGSAAKSKLFHRVEVDDMPPDGEKPRLNKDDVALIKKWIDAGAPDFNAAAAERKFIS